MEKLAEEQGKFFDNLEIVFRKVFEDENLKLVFIRAEYEFYLQRSDGERLTFNQLSDGFSAFVGIVLELLVRVDMIQSQQKDHTFDPLGIVVIDEPETHLHLELQYPGNAITNALISNIQFYRGDTLTGSSVKYKNATVCST